MNNRNSSMNNRNSSMNNRNSSMNNRNSSGKVREMQDSQLKRATDSIKMQLLKALNENKVIADQRRTSVKLADMKRSTSNNAMNNNAMNNANNRTASGKLFDMKRSRNNAMNNAMDNNRRLSFLNQRGGSHKPQVDDDDKKNTHRRYVAYWRHVHEKTGEPHGAPKMMVGSTHKRSEFTGLPLSAARRAIAHLTTSRRAFKQHVHVVGSTKMEEKSFAARKAEVGMNVPVFITLVERTLTNILSAPIKDNKYNITNGDTNNTFQQFHYFGVSTELAKVQQITINGTVLNKSKVTLICPAPSTLVPMTLTNAVKQHAQRGADVAESKKIKIKTNPFLQWTKKVL
jgi:hypothetical protein